MTARNRELQSRVPAIGQQVSAAGGGGSGRSGAGASPNNNLGCFFLEALYKCLILVEGRGRELWMGQRGQGRK